MMIIAFMSSFNHAVIRHQKVKKENLMLILDLNLLLDDALKAFTVIPKCDYHLGGNKQMPSDSDETRQRLNPVSPSAPSG